MHWRCWIGKHDFEIVRPVSDQSALVGCHNCSRLWGCNFAMQIMVPWHLVSDFYDREHVLWRDC